MIVLRSIAEKYSISQLQKMKQQASLFKPQISINMLCLLVYFKTLQRMDNDLYYYLESQNQISQRQMLQCLPKIQNIITFISFYTLMLIIPISSISPSFSTSLTDCKTGSAVLTTTGTTSNGFDSSITTVTFPSAFTQTPSVSLGLGYLDSLYTTTTSLHTWIFDLTIQASSSSQTFVNFNRSSGVFSQISINYLAVLNSSFLQVTYSKLDLSQTTLFTITNAQTRSEPRNITYRGKSNSTNAVVIINTVGIHGIRQNTNTFIYTLGISAQFQYSYEVTVSVGPYNRANFVAVFGISYESIATTIRSPYYLNLGYLTDFSGTIAETSGAIGITSMGTIFTGMTSWTIDDSNGVNKYNFSLSNNNYLLVSNSLTASKNSYVWYRQQTCPQYYYLLSHDCLVCHISCASCSGGLSTNCLSCSSTRSYNALTGTCQCLTGYIDQGSRDCTLLSCNVDLCKTCSYINQCGSCYSFLFRELNGTQCVCMKYRYDHYSLDGSPFCDSCHYSCYTCTNSASTSCSSCNTARDFRQLRASNSTCQCLVSYYDSNTTICSKCQYTCASCVTGSYCTGCNSTKGRLFDSTSTYCACRTGLYDDRLQQTCRTCMYTCLGCVDAVSCSSCPSTRYLTNTTNSNNQCLCMDGYFDNGISALCQRCQYTCQTCIISTQCSSCSSIMHRQFNNVTKLCICSVGYYDDGTNQLCATCNVLCLGCNGGSSLNCTSCDINSHRSLALDKQCLCTNGYYQVNSNTELCANCYYTCQRCVNNYQCLSCNNLKFRVANPTNPSACICMDSYYDNENQICIKCPYYCLTCNNSSSCLTCDNITRNISSNCMCNVGFYDNGVDSSCLPCLGQCVQCLNGYNCTSCNSPSRYLTGTGQCKCSIGYLQPSCSLCSYQCQQCINTPENCISCNGLYFRALSINNTTGKGSCICYDGYYSDNINVLCKSCPYSCQTCNSSTSCLTCPINREFDVNRQFCVCISQFYQNNQSLNCLPCHYTCGNCSDYSICTQCNSNKFRFLNPLTRLCSCNIGFYDDGRSQLCYACSSQCKTCTSYIYCLSCDLQIKFRILNNATHRCPCTQGYFQSTNFTCTPCDYSCLSCLDGRSCLSCRTDRVININTGLCECRSGSFQNSTTLNCSACLYPCSTCTQTSSTCRSCQGTHVLLLSSSLCYCDKGTYENTTICATCLSTCYQCTNNRSCTSCRASNNRQLTTVQGLNNCLCIQGFHDENGTTVTCNACHYSCLSCTNSQSCGSCKDIRIQLNGTNNFCICPLERFYDDETNNPICLPCNYLCLSCNKLSVNCTSCLSSAYRQLLLNDATTNQSTCRCIIGYYHTGVQICSACDYSCRSCINSTHCETCNSSLNRFLNSTATTYCACRLGYYDVTNIQNCQLCHYTCLSCIQAATFCVSCPQTRNLSSNSCPCNEGMFNNFLPNNSTCLTCLYLCQTCNNGYECLTCPLQTRSMNSSNLCSCLSGFYDSGIDRECLSCHPTCKQCSDFNKCTACFQSTQLRVPFNFLCICQQGYYDDTSNNATNYICKPCNYSCQRCQNSLSCSSCDSTSFRIRNANNGYCKCSNGYYDDGLNQLCIGCSFDCLTCMNSTFCIDCPPERTLDNTTNRCICSPNYFTNGTVCLSCPPQCLTCNSFNDCTSCNNPTQRTLVSGSCLCNSKLYPISNSPSCVACHYSCNTCNSFPFCLNCSSSSKRYFLGKQCKCLPSFYDDLANETCKSCHYSCLTCSIANQCLTCDTSPSTNRIFNNTSKICSCNVGYYQDPSLKICIKCHYSCYTCSSSSHCNSCSSNSLRVLNSTSSQCLCPPIGYFDLSLVPICQPCNPTCYSCVLSSTICTDCNQNITFRSLNQQSQCICKSGYFQSVTLGVICLTCSHQCEKCSLIPTQCTSCLIENNRDNSTLPNCSCLEGFYDDGASPQCKLCDYRCLTCLDPYKCTTCDEANHFRQLNIISEICICLNQFYETNLNNLTRNPVCSRCHYTCLSCNHPTICLTCDNTNNTRVFRNGQCSCQSGYFDDGQSLTCLPCRYQCQTCSSNFTCLTCNFLHNRQLNVSSGVCQCFVGYYDINNGLDSMCYQCHSSCATCRNSTNCQTCYPLTNKYVNSSQGTGYCICLYGYYQVSSTRICYPCHYSCQKCFFTSTTCTTCDANAHRILSSGSCVCQSGYHDDGRNQACIQCIQNCFRCFGPNPGQCLVCQNGTFLLNGVCWNSCPDFYYQINSTWSCDSCLSYCRYCQNSQTCINCQSGFYLIPSSLNNLTFNCISPCPDFYYHNNTNCLQCVSPCRRCTALFVCTDCIQSYFLQNATGSCYPCHRTCRYCRSSSALGCVSCVDGYFLNSTLGLCVKMTCPSTQYVNSLYGCYSCKDTYPNSIECNSNFVTKCSDGYILTNNTLTHKKQCVRCDKVPGYVLVSSTGLCQQICGDGIRYNDPCDDGNNQNGDGCSSICSVQSFWQCNVNLRPSTCTLSTSVIPKITVEAVSKGLKQNKIYITLNLNVGIRLKTQNFLLKFGNLQKFTYKVTNINMKYTKFKLEIQYFESIAKQKLSISVKSPVSQQSTLPPNSPPRQLTQIYSVNRFLQQTETPLTITLQLNVDVLISTASPAIYYSSQARNNFTSILYILLIALHVLSIVLFAYFTFYLRIKIMLFTIQLFNFLTLLYIYSTYGLWSVSQLASEAARALQHFIYKFGEQLPQKYAGSSTSPGYFGFGGFVISGCLIQLIIVITCIIVKILHGGVSTKEDKTVREGKERIFNAFRYYHIGFLYAFMPDLLLCCIIVFKWIEINNSIQSAYSWGTSIIVLLMIFIQNGMYLIYAAPYSKIMAKNTKENDNLNIKRFQGASNNAKTFIIGDSKQNGMEEAGPKNLTKNFVTVEEAMSQIREKNDDEAYENIKFDPFQSEEIDKRKTSMQFISDKSQIKLNDKNKINETFQKQIQEIFEQNKTEAVIFQNQQRSQKSNQAINTKNKQNTNRQMEAKTERSARTQSTTISQIQNKQIIPLFDIAPCGVTQSSLSNINVSYHLNVLHQSELPFKSGFVSLIICIVAQIQQPIPRTSLLVLAQIVLFVYNILIMRCRNFRTIKNLVMIIALLGISGCGLAGSLVINLNTEENWNKNKQSIVSTLYILEILEISLVFFALTWNIIMYILQVLKSNEFRLYLIEKKNQEILQKNIRRNRLRNIGLPHKEEVTQSQGFGFKNIFANIYGQEQGDNEFIPKSKLRSESDIENTNTKIMIGNREKRTLDIIDIDDNIEDEKYDPNHKMHRKLKTAIQQNQYNTLNGNGNSKKKDKQYLSNSLEEIEAHDGDRQTNLLQSTRLNESRNKKRKRTGGKESSLDEHKVTNWMDLLQKQMIGQQNNSQTIGIINQDNNPNKQYDKDNTLISYKQSEKQQKKKSKQSVEIQKKEEEVKRQSISGKRSSYSIIKQLIPTRDDSPVKQEDDEEQQEIQDEEFQEEVEVKHEIQQKNTFKKKNKILEVEQKDPVHYTYKIQGNKNVKLKKKKKNKNKGIITDNTNIKIKKQRFLPTIKINTKIEDDLDIEQDLSINEDAHQLDRNLYQRQDVELPSGLKDGFGMSQYHNDGEIQIIQKYKKRNPNNKKNLSIQQLNDSDNTNEFLAIKGKKYKKAKDQEQYQEEEEDGEKDGVTVFKKILKDYQIYKNKRIPQSNRKY